MKKIAAAAVLLFLCMALTAWAEQQSSGFAGTWIYDSEKSEPLHPVMAMGGMGGGMPGGMGGGGMPGGGMGGGMPGGGMGGGRGMGGGMPGGGMGGGRGMGGGMPGARAGGQAPQNPRTVPMTIEQNGNEIKITRTVLGQQAVQIMNADGAEHEEMVAAPNQKEKVKETTKVTLKKDKLTIQKVTHYPQYNVKYKGEFELSDNASTLTIKTVNSNPTQQWEEKQVYHKQAPQN